MTRHRVKNVVKIKVPQEVRFVVLDDKRGRFDQFGKDALLCSDRNSVLEACSLTSPDSLWISRRAKNSKVLAKTLVELITDSPPGVSRFGSLLALEATAEVRPTLEGLFRPVVGASQQFKSLPWDELADVLTAPADEKRDVFIGGEVNVELGSLVLVRGDLERVVVPLTIFRPSGNAYPDFGKFNLGDYGHTLRFGKYEATSDVILWEIDADYRKRVKAKEREQAVGFGPSLRRLRLQRGLTQADFPQISRKTIARIENGEVEKPHGTTLHRISKTLRVSPEEIETY